MTFLWKLTLSWILLISLTLSLSSFANHPSPSFSPAEHVAIGNDIKLFFKADDKGQKAAPLGLPNGTTLTYGDIIAIGDFYGTVNQPIALGESEAERTSRFLVAFNMFARDMAYREELEKIITVIHEEHNTVIDGMKNGEEPTEIYKKIGSDPSRKINCITGGGCDPSTWWLSQGRSLALTSDNYDHFGKNALIAYSTGHALALNVALAAHNTQNVKQLQLAYAMNAFASHFLTDRYASGHMRTPRIELPQNVSPSFIGSLLAGIMHNEENINGLHVSNKRGDKWIAYGDKSYFTQKNELHKILLHEALQLSTNDIFTAYQYGKSEKSDATLQLIPEPDEWNNASTLDISPLFYWDPEAKALMRRSDLANLYDRNWTSNWWGWSTLVALGGEKGIPILAQATLIRSGYGEDALKAGLITDKNMLAYLKNRH